MFITLKSIDKEVKPPKRMGQQPKGNGGGVSPH